MDTRGHSFALGSNVLGIPGVFFECYSFLGVCVVVKCSPFSLHHARQDQRTKPDVVSLCETFQLLSIS